MDLTLAPRRAPCPGDVPQEDIAYGHLTDLRSLVKIASTQKADNKNAEVMPRHTGAIKQAGMYQY